jgi:hypothetical protein
MGYMVKINSEFNKVKVKKLTINLRELTLK